MTKRKYLFLYLFVAFVIVSCKKNAVTPVTPIVPVIKMDTDVYVSGSVVAANGKYVACFWKNGVITKLADSSSTTFAQSITISGSDVYLAGILNVNNQTSAVYWKNGVMTKLAGGGDAEGIAISGADVYACGNVFTNNHNVAIYWKNGAAQFLKDNSPDTYANYIAVSGTDVYIAGASLPKNGKTRYGTYWKNNQFVNLTDSLHESQGMAVAVNGTDVYITGYTGSNGTVVTTYWKNDIPVTLPSGFTGNSIAVNDHNICIAGSGGFDGAYWKNGVITNLTDGSSETQANAIAVEGDDVYVAGFEFRVSNKGTSPVYWKNGILVNLVANSDVLNQVTGIAIVVHPH